MAILALLVPVLNVVVSEVQITLVFAVQLDPPENSVVVKAEARVTVADRFVHVALIPESLTAPLCIMRTVSPAAIEDR